MNVFILSLTMPVPLSASALAPSDHRIFTGLTVHENLEMAILRPRQQQTPWTLNRVYQTCPLLVGLKTRKGGNLSGGEQQTLAIARAPVGNPLMLLPDELCWVPFGPHDQTEIRASHRNRHLVR